MSQKIKKNEYAQTFMEYTILITIVASILIAMTPLLRRTAQGMVKFAADQVGNQLEAEQIGGTRVGYLIVSVTETATDKSENVKHIQDTTLTEYFNNNMATSTQQKTNLGYRPAPLKGTRLLPQ